MNDLAPYEIRLKRPAKNALDAETIGFLDRELDRAGGRPVLLAGSDGAFCVGLNLKFVSELEPSAMLPFLRSLDTFVERLFRYPAPVVAAVGGHAIAGGAVLALAADLVVAIDHPGVRIGVNEVALGACFPPFMLRMVQARLDPAYAERVMLSARLFAPREALFFGLVHELAEHVEEAARKRLSELAAHPAEAYALTKEALRSRVRAGDEDERRFAEREIPVWNSAELHERMLSVLNK